MPAVNPIAVVYIPVMTPTFLGNLSLIIPGIRTFKIAIPAPTINVPRNNKETQVAERISKPNVKKIIPNVTASSFVNFALIAGTIVERNENATSGNVVSKPTDQLETPKSSRIIPSNGPTEDITGRKLNEANKIPAIKKY